MTKMINKSVMTVDGETVNMSMPFAKVDKNKRLVSGYATLDNIDTQGDIVLATASAKAFSRARGNIREMHQPLAVGKMVSFREDEFFDEDSKKLYRGIFVTARISEGAEDTWKKVLDGTLTGFSIGGAINEISNEFVKEAGKTVRFIKDFDLTELSLVDNPANQLANIRSFEKNIFSIDRADNGSVAFTKGMIAETVIENVFICKDDHTVIVKDSKTQECPVCEAGMENAGWFESGINRSEKVSDIVTKFLTPDIDTAPTNEGGAVDMNPLKKEKDTSTEAEVKVENEDTSEEVTETPETETESAEPVEEEVSEVESPEEVVDTEEEISKKMDDLHNAIKKSLEDNQKDTFEKVSELESKLDEAITKFSELDEKISGFDEKLQTSKSRMTDLENRLEKFNSSDALRKSATQQAPAQVVQRESFWGNAFSD